MSRTLLHLAAFWVDGDRGDEIADYLADLKVEGSRGAVVTFSIDTASGFTFRRTMEHLNLAEVNDYPSRASSAPEPLAS